MGKIFSRFSRKRHNPTIQLVETEGHLELNSVASNSECAESEQSVTSPEKIEIQITNSLEDIDENNEILTGLKRLNSERRLEQVVRFCEDLRHEYSEWNNEQNSKDYDNRMCDCLEERLTVTYFNMRDKEKRDQELGDVIFYYLMKGEHLDEHVQTIIHRLNKPLYDPACYNYSWYELCCVVLGVEKTFNQFYKRLDSNKTALRYLLDQRQPQLLLNRKSSELMERLIDILPYGDLYQIITNIKDENGQTHMFYLARYLMYVKLYNNHVDDLYSLLSIRNTNGQTALYINTVCITHLLADTYTPKRRDALLKLTSIIDNNHETALQLVSDKNDLRSLLRRVEDNCYVTWSKYDVKIIIIYNTNNRLGAEEEAEIMYNACKSKYNEDNITVQKNQTEQKIIQLIKQKANQETWRDYLPKSLVVILSSHGSVGTINDCDGNPIKLSDIEEAMCSDILDGKPKMLITQCCQTSKISKETNPYAPTHPDFCALMSCVTGQTSERGVLLKKLAEKIRNSEMNTGIFKLVSRVNAEMSREGREQTPVLMSTLKAGFFPTDKWSVS